VELQVVLMDQARQILRWLLVLPAALLVYSFVCTILASILMLLLIPVEHIFIDRSLTGKVVGAGVMLVAQTAGMYASSCVAYIMAPSRREQVMLAAAVVVCIPTVVLIWWVSHNPTGSFDAQEAFQGGLLLLLMQFIAIPLMFSIFHPSRIFKTIENRFPDAESRFVFNLEFIQLALLCIGFSIGIIDFAPVALRVALPVAAISLALVPITSAYNWKKLSKRSRSVSLSFSAVSIVQLALVLCCFPRAFF
jgi:hypothetical protein